MLQSGKVRIELTYSNECNIIGSSLVFINAIKQLRRLVFQFLFKWEVIYLRE